MNETKISYRCNLEDAKAASLEYSKKFGNMSKKMALKMIFIPLAVVVLTDIAFLVFMQDVAAVITTILCALIFIPLMVVFMRYSNKKGISNRSELLYRFDFNKTSASEICLDNEFITKTSAYSKEKFPYAEVENVISNRMYFIIKFSGDERLNVVPKRGQNADSLFTMDNIFREKLGEKFLYDM